MRSRPRRPLTTLLAVAVGLLLVADLLLALPRVRRLLGLVPPAKLERPALPPAPGRAMR